MTGRIRPKLRTVLADSGYISEENFARVDTDGLRLLALLAKDPADATSGRRNTPSPGPASGHRPGPAAAAPSSRPGRLHAAGPFGGRVARCTIASVPWVTVCMARWLLKSVLMKALVLFVDEKSQIQALDRTASVLPVLFGTAERASYDYMRHGTTSLFAALEVASGLVIARHYRRHRQQEFLRFLKLIDAAVPAGLELHRSATTTPPTRPRR